MARRSAGSVGERGRFFAEFEQELNLWARQAGWLAAPIKDSDKTRGASYRDEGTPLPYPEVTLPHMVEFLLDVGPLVPAGMGHAPLSALELGAWCAGCGESLSPWEFRTVLGMARAYHGEYEQGRAPTRQAPYIEDMETQRERIEKRTRAMFRGE